MKKKISCYNVDTCGLQTSAAYICNFYFFNLVGTAFIQVRAIVQKLRYPHFGLQKPACNSHFHLQLQLKKTTTKKLGFDFCSANLLFCCHFLLIKQWRTEKHMDVLLFTKKSQIYSTTLALLLVCLFIFLSTQCLFFFFCFYFWFCSLLVFFFLSQNHFSVSDTVQRKEKTYYFNNSLVEMFFVRMFVQDPKL